MKKHLLLLGGGHAHLAVLHALLQRRVDNWQVSLISPSRYQIYSGMLPGWLAGHYDLAQCRIDLQTLASAAGVEFLLDKAIQLDAGQQIVRLASGQQLNYQLLSLDIGSESPVAELLPLAARLLPIRPIETFVHAWPLYQQQQNLSPQAQRLAVVGGGAAGVELAFALQYALHQINPVSNVTLFASESGLLPGHNPQVRAAVTRTLQQRGINLLLQRVKGHADGLLPDDGRVMPFDLVLAAPGAQAATWLSNCGLDLDPTGFIVVNDCHQSTSHPNVFAAGDVCARSCAGFSRSGVHAVKAGPVLAANLLNMMAGSSKLSRYTPRTTSLYLLATGPKQAIASWGSWCAQGAWVWRWKDWIDRGFIRRQSLLSPP